jgi:hypothetical protein
MSGLFILILFERVFFSEECSVFGDDKYQLAEMEL